MRRAAFVGLAFAFAIAGPRAMSDAQPMHPVLTAKPPSAFVGTNIAFAYAPLAPRTAAITIAYGDGSTGTLYRTGSTIGGSSTAMGTHRYARAGAYRACVPATKAVYPSLAAAPVCTVVNIIATISTPTPTPTPTPEPTPSAAPVAAAPAPLYPITGWTLAWANGLYAVNVPASNAIPPAIAQITVGSAKRVIGQWIVDGLPAATQTKTQTMPGDVLTFEYDFPQLPSAQRDSSIHRVAFRLLDPIASAPAGAPTAAPSIAYRYDMTRNAAPIAGPGVAVSDATAALQFDGFLVAIGHLRNDPAGTVSGDGTAQLADLTFSVRFSVLTIGNAHATALGVTSDVMSGNATTSAAAACVRTAPNGGSSDAAFAGELGTFHRFSYAFSLMSATLAPLGAQSTVALCFAPPNVQRGDAAHDGFNLARADDTTFGDPAARALALGLANVPIDEDGAFAFDLPGDAVASWRVGDSTFATTPDASVPYHFAFANGSAAPHVSCDGTPATGTILQSLDARPVQSILSHCAWLPGGVEATIALAPKTAVTTADPYRFELVFDEAEFSVANSVFAGGPMRGTFFVNRSAPASKPAEPSAAFLPMDVGERERASDPSGTFEGTFSKIGDLAASATLVPAGRTSLFASGGQDTRAPSGGLGVALDSGAPSIPRASAVPIGPRPSFTVVPGTTTFEIRWPAAVGYRGYMLIRRDPAGHVVTLDPLVRAFSYRDALASGAHGDFAYALRIVSVHGVGPAGPFASARGTP